MRSGPPRAAKTRSYSCANSSRSTAGSAVVTVFEVGLLEDRPGRLTFRASGKRAGEVFKDEGGGHRFQRVPPNEKRGRVHTSTVTVAVLDDRVLPRFELGSADLEWWAVRGSGAGGQHRNVTDSAVTVRHKPTGIEAHAESERSQHQNRLLALRVLELRLQAREARAHAERENGTRRAQIGSGQRGDKIRTIRYQDGVVTDHRSGRKWALRDYLRGQW